MLRFGMALTIMILGSMGIRVHAKELQISDRHSIDLGTLGGSYSFARDINAQGNIVGESSTSSGETYAFKWRQGSMEKLGAPPFHLYSMANGLNNRDQIVGYARKRANAGAARALLWDQGQMIPLPHLPGASYSQASDLNDAEEIVGVSGTVAVMWKNRKPRSLGTLGGKYSIALAVNQKSWVVGNSLTISGETHACLWRDGKARDLGTLGGRFSTANAIDEEGRVVGSSETHGGAIHAFVWEKGIMRDLGPGMIRSINREGLMGGEATDSTANVHAALWSPDDSLSTIDEPEATYSSIFSVNDKGIAVGIREVKSMTSAGKAALSFRAMLWTP